MPYNTFRPGGSWEYEMFTEVLTSSRYPEKKFARIHQNAPLNKASVQDYDHQLARLIDKAARNLLQRVGDQGWEPVDAVDADSLWVRGRVRYTDEAGFKASAGENKEFEPTTVSILCRRRVKYSNSQVTAQSEGTILTSPIQGKSRS